MPISGTSKSRRWTHQLASELQGRLERELAATKESGIATQAWLVERILGSDEISSEGQLYRTLCILAALNDHAQNGGLTDHQVDRLVEVAYGFFRLNDVHPGTSKLGALLESLHSKVSAIRVRQGEPWLAGWEQLFARFAGRADDTLVPGISELQQAARSIRLGHVDTALQDLDPVQPYMCGKSALPEGWLLRLQALRLTGNLGDARRAAETLGKLPMSERTKLEFEWERLSVEAQEKGSVSGLVGANAFRKSHRNLEFVHLGKLWALATHDREWLTRVSKCETIRRQFRAEFHADPTQLKLHEIVKTIEAGYDGLIPLHLRVRAMGEALAKAGALATLEQELLVWAASARCLTRLKQWTFAELVLAEYRSLAARLGASKNIDPLNVISDLVAKTSLQGDGEDSEALQKISWFGRTVQLSRMAAAISFSLTRGWFQRVGTDAATSDRLRAHQMQAIGDILVDHLGILKGALGKVGQVASYMQAIVPHEIRGRLEALQSSATPMPKKQVERIFGEDFSRLPTELFAGWSPEPLAAASIGQVHKARLSDGTVVAVKVQYPRMPDVIRSDMRSLKFLKPVFGPIFPAVDLGGLLEEVETRLLEECDYKRELANQEAFRKICSEIPGVDVPKPYPEYSSGRILTMDYIDGQSFAEFVATATPAEKNEAGRAIFRLFVHSGLNHGLVYADLHPGNFLFRNGKVCLLDFGLAKVMPTVYLDAVKDMIRAAREGNVDLFRPIMVRLGFARKDQEYDFVGHFALALRTTFSPWAESREFQYSHDFVRRDFEENTLANPNLTSLDLPRDYALLLRSYLGLASLLADLEAKANWHDLMSELLGQRIALAG